MDEQFLVVELYLTTSGLYDPLDLVDEENHIWLESFKEAVETVDSMPAVYRNPISATVYEYPDRHIVYHRRFTK